MPPRRRAEASESLDFHELGHRGRKTGISLPDGGERDEHGMQPLENLFSSPTRPPAETNGNHDSGSEDMDISSSGGPGPDTLLRNQRNAKLPVPRSRSPMKTNLGSPPRKNPNVERIPSPPRDLIADDVDVSRNLEFDANFDESAVFTDADVTGVAKPNGFGPNGLGGGSTLDLANNSVEESVLLLDAINRQDDAVVSASQERPEEASQPAEPPVRRRRGRPRRQDRPQDDSQSSQVMMKKRRSPRSSLIADDNGTDASQQAPVVQDQRQAKRQRTKGPGVSMAPPPLPPPEKPAPVARKEVAEAEEENALEEALEEGAASRQKQVGRRQKQAEAPKKQVEASQKQAEAPRKQAESQDKHAKRQNTHAESKHAESRTTRAENRQEHAASQSKDAESHKKRSDGRQKTAKVPAEEPEPDDEEPKPRRRGRPARKAKAEGAVAEASFTALQRGPPMPKSRGLVSVRRDGDSMTQTRSGRHSYRPVEYWRGEQVICEDEEQNDMFHNNGDFLLPTIKEVVRVPAEAPPSKRTPRSGKARPKSQARPAEEEELEEWEVSQGFVTGEVVLWEPEHEEHPPGEEEAVQVMNDRIAISADAIQTSDIKDATFRFAKTLTTPFMGSGVVDLPPGAEKRPKNSRKMHMVFFVHYGKVLVTLNETQFRITAGGTWFVPRGECSHLCYNLEAADGEGAGNYYSIANDYDSPSRIFFAQACELQLPRGDEKDGTVTRDDTTLA
ncbi:hypothetical protein XA68_15771 [Ophiocordyceps unilateralis]|uniref:Mif2/CENP-C cupin domain-containing protein n=1 Tax=Ophiocordyceps unilateralis TaxID=268505 RepID=A0A2A9P7K8_OPHUN|nr:hypothetical protein XA68_15771 [Ophiocordyceps unilateralis]